jgi:hypothetical protein
VARLSPTLGDLHIRDAIGRHHHSYMVALVTLALKTKVVSNSDNPPNCFFKGQWCISIATRDGAKKFYGRGPAKKNFLFLKIFLLKKSIFVVF